MLYIDTVALYTVPFQIFGSAFATYICENSVFFEVLVQ